MRAIGDRAYRIDRGERRRSHGRNDSRDVVELFFFSSRRRHTRLQGDWSSDVCSSDLHGRDRATLARLEVVALAKSETSGQEAWETEERRVGKECRSRWSPYH